MRQDILFDQQEVTCIVTPETDTLYFGYSSPKVDTLPDQYNYVFTKSLIYIDRWSTAKFKRDFTVGDSFITTNGFWAMCNLTRYTGEFYIIVYPEKITKPCFLKLTTDLSDAILSDTIKYPYSMTIHLVPSAVVGD